jgi:hypothetical protein
VGFDNEPKSTRDRDVSWSRPGGCAHGPCSYGSVQPAL